MKVIVTSTGKQADSRVDRSFGRAKWHLLFDTETGTFSAHSNIQNFEAAQGAGIQAAQNVARLGTDAVITGNVGPKAFKTLSVAGISSYIFDHSIETVEEAISAWKKGRLTKVTEATIESHWV